MKNGRRKNLLLAVGLAVGIAGSAWANVPPPPVNQNLGIPDTVFNNLREQDCRFCHRNDGTAPTGVPVKTTYLPDRHHALVGTPQKSPTAAPNPSVGAGKYDCLTCHTLVWNAATSSFVFAPFRDCTICHKQSAGAPITVHHMTSYAQAGNCSRCHGYITDLTKIPVKGTYPASLVTPWPSKKPNGAPGNTAAGEAPGKAGNCDYCHNNAANTVVRDPLNPLPPAVDTASGIKVYTNADTHHSTGIGQLLGSPAGTENPVQCAWCHDTAAPTGLKIRACENCHDIATLHSIQADSNGNGVVAGNELPYYGHIGGQTDCWGCHGFLGATAEGMISAASIDGVDATADLVKGKAITMNLTGSGFATQTVDPMTGNLMTVTGKLELTDSNGNVTTLTPSTADSGTASAAVKFAAAGNYRLRVNNGRLSNAVVITVADAVKINSASCTNNVVTVTGSGFSSYTKAADSGTGLAAYDARGRAVSCKVKTWGDKAISASCAANPSKVVVKSVWGAASKSVR